MSPRTSFFWSVLVAGVLLAAGAGCSEREPLKPRTASPAPSDTILEENRKAAEALVHAARDAAERANEGVREAIETLTAAASDAGKDAKRRD